MNHSGKTPYSELAPVYDFVMSHVDYTGWCWYIKKIHKKFKVPEKEILELGGGTGKLASLFSRASGWNWVLTDRSAEMIREARLKKELKETPMLIQDCRHPALRRRFGFIVFLYDGINYLLSKQELLFCLREIKKILKNGGLFLFDVTTEANSKKYFQNETFFEEEDHCSYIRESRYNPRRRLQFNHFRIFIKDPSGMYHLQEESHMQHVFRLSDIEDAIVRGGLEIEGVWEGFTFRRADQRSERVHFLVRNP